VSGHIFGAMSTRIYMRTDANGEVVLQRIDPFDQPSAKITVRGPDVLCMWPGIWINGKRTYDTYLILDGEPLMHSPVEHVGRACFDQHEKQGGGHPL
jgi:hypothetical protein